MSERQIPVGFVDKQRVPKLAPLIEEALTATTPEMPGKSQTKQITDKKTYKPRARKAKNNAKGKEIVRITKPGYPTLATVGSDTLALSAPTNTTRINRAGRPKIQYRGNGDCYIVHREYIMDATASVTMTTTGLAINPGLSSTCPWLSRIASNYESYVFDSLKFHFETQSSTVATGTVIMTVDYDAADAAPTTKTQALAYRGAVRSAPWASCCHVSAPEDLRKRKTYFVRAGNLAPGKDVNLYDTGNFYFLSLGQGGVGTSGELWIDYAIKLMTPRALSAGGGNAIWGQYDPVDNTNICQYTGGNLPASVVSSGTTTAVMTVTFTQPWQGVCTFDYSGTGLVAAVFGGTATRTDAWSVVNGGTSQLVGHVTINAIGGQTLTVTIGNTTIVPAANNGVWFTQGLGAL